MYDEVSMKDKIRLSHYNVAFPFKPINIQHRSVKHKPTWLTTGILVSRNKFHYYDIKKVLLRKHFKDKNIFNFLNYIKNFIVHCISMFKIRVFCII